MRTLLWMLVGFGTVWCLVLLGLAVLVVRFIREDHKRHPKSARGHVRDAVRLVRDPWMVRDMSMGRDIGPFVTEESAEAFARRSKNMIVVRKGS